MLKFPRKEEGKTNGRKGKISEKKGREEGKGKRRGEKGTGIEWGGTLGKEKNVCKK